MTVEPHQLERGNITAHSGHWKKENTFLAKLWRHILGGLETQKFWISSFQRHVASGGFYNQSDDEKCNWQLWTCMKNVTPRILGEIHLQLFLMVAIHSHNWTLNLDLHVHMHSLQAAAQKNLYGQYMAILVQWLLHLQSYFVASMLYATFIFAPTWEGWVWVFPLGHEYYEHQYLKLYTAKTLGLL